MPPSGDACGWKWPPDAADEDGTGPGHSGSATGGYGDGDGATMSAVLATPPHLPAPHSSYARKFSDFRARFFLNLSSESDVRTEFDSPKKANQIIFPNFFTAKLDLLLPQLSQTSQHSSNFERNEVNSQLYHDFHSKDNVL